jgi:hypothetical protein
MRPQVILTDKGRLIVEFRNNCLVFFPEQTFVAEANEILFTLSLDDLQRLVDMAEEGS